MKVKVIKIIVSVKGPSPHHPWADLVYIQQSKLEIPGGEKTNTERLGSSLNLTLSKNDIIFLFKGQKNVSFPLKENQVFPHARESQQANIRLASNSVNSSLA